MMDLLDIIRRKYDVPDLIRLASNIPGILNEKGKENEHTICLEQDDELYGKINSFIVQVPYSNGPKVSNNEMVKLVREPNNIHDSNAVKVENMKGELAGYVKDHEQVLARIMDLSLAKVEGFVPYGADNRSHIPLQIRLWGAAEKKKDVVEFLQSHGLNLWQPLERAKASDFEMPGPGVPSCSSSNSEHRDYSKRLLTPEEMANGLDKIFETVEEGDKTTEADPALAIKTPLHLHQKQALNWMICRENKNELPPFWEMDGDEYVNTLTMIQTRERPKNIRGGILADDMGLGKTLTMIALILTNFVDGKPLAYPRVDTTKRYFGHLFEQVSNNSVCSKQKHTKPSDCLSSSFFLSRKRKANNDGLSETEPLSEVHEMKSTKGDGQGKRTKLPAETINYEKRDHTCCIEISTQTDEADFLFETGNDSLDLVDSLKDIPSRKKADRKQNMCDKVKSQMSSKIHGKERSAECGVVVSEDKDIYSTKETTSSSSSDVIVLDYLPDEDCIIISDSDDDKEASTISSDKEDFPSDCDGMGRSQTSGPRGTLIVCPLCVINVWEGQFEEHVEETVYIKLYVHHGIKRSSDIEFLKEHDIVITTYGTLSSDFRKLKDDSPLHQIEWLRIVLDEGHEIRNPLTLQSEAIFALNADRRWVLTGTAIQNTLKDLLSLLNFLRLQPFAEPGRYWWNTAIARPVARSEEDGLKRVAELMKNVALRRTKNQEWNGKPLIELPVKRIVEEKVIMNEEDRKMYDEIYQRGTITIKRLDIGRAILIYRQLLLRLRQLCCHSKLIATSASFLDSLDSLDQTHTNNSATSDDDEDISDEEKKILLDKLLDVLNSDSNGECSICLENISTKSVITTCAHFFCRSCIEDHIERRQPNPLCPMCREPLNKKLIEVPCVPMQDDTTAVETGHYVSSPKIDALMKALNQLRQSNPAEKSVVVSSFTSFLNLIEISLKNEGFEFRRLDGKMTAKARVQAITEFSRPEPGSPTVFLLSITAGGVGISLTAASRVFLMEPHWNPAKEEQCFDRCHRQGQTKEVVITKFITENSIEEQMLEVQDRKRNVMKKAFAKKPSRDGMR